MSFVAVSPERLNNLSLNNVLHGDGFPCANPDVAVYAVVMDAHPMMHVGKAESGFERCWVAVGWRNCGDGRGR